MIQPIVRSKLYEDVSRQIKELIKTGTWEEGMRIPTENELAAQFHVGRNSVREAIKSLQMTGILTSSPGRGTFVTGNALHAICLNELFTIMSDEKYMTDLIETRLALESYMAYLAARRADASDLSAMDGILKVMHGCTSKEELMKQGYLFHRKIAEAAGNKILSGFYHSIETQLLSQRDLDFLTMEVYQRGIGDHEAILQAIKAHEADLAKTLMEQHLRRDYQRYLDTRAPE